MYSINFTVAKKRLCLRLHYNRENSYLFVNGKEIVKFKAKDFEIVASPLCLGSISKDCSAYNMEKTGLNGYVYEFNGDYTGINKTVDTVKVKKYVTLKYDIK